MLHGQATSSPMGKDAGWNLLSSNRLVPQARPSKDAAWEASGVFFPAQAMPEVGRIDSRKSTRSPSPPNGEHAVPAPASRQAAFVVPRLEVPSASSRRFALCLPHRHLRTGVSLSGSRASRISQGPAGVRMSSTAVAIPSWVRRDSCRSRKHWLRACACTIRKLSAHARQIHHADSSLLKSPRS